PCTKEGTEIVVLTVDSMTHAWPGSFGSSDIKASEEYWAFFKTHAKGGVGVSQAVTAIKMKRPVSVRYVAGNIYLQSDSDIRSILVFDIQGEAILRWETMGTSVKSAVVPMIQVPRGIYLFSVSNAAGKTAAKVVAP
ncbi:MAG: hypothetical protein JXA71_07425, partial [Chitinispirillaceae bacterium]|nr:hypothetical protein [Chitinispirillaceae bacterium]